ncbi:MAG: OmpW family outer membrane protein [Rhodocyclaceae bacterium]|jgi:outer membrane protein|nr:OmpW family outer membrane protein [Rhodocyclaceae bacterium]
MNAKLVAVLIATGFSWGAYAQSAPEGDWLVRLRAVQIDTANESSGGGPLALPSDAVHVSNKTIPELDISYFFTKNIAAELILTYPQKHDIKLEGVGKLGSLHELPPSLLLQYHFLPEGTVRPYMGVGVNYTRFSKVDLGPLEVDKDSFGLALQVGVDVKLADKLFLNMDVKKVKMGTDVSVSGVGKITTVHVDPWLFGIGVGYRF